ncbi:MAG: hypothetical protein WC043_00965 [Pseudobdellovibrionaceae bacterium]
MKKSTLTTEFFIMASLLTSLGMEAVHYHDVHNPHSDRRERQQRIFDAKMETRRANPRVAGRLHHEPLACCSEPS